MFAECSVTAPDTAVAAPRRLAGGAALGAQASWSSPADRRMAMTAVLTEGGAAQAPLVWCHRSEVVAA